MSAAKGRKLARLSPRFSRHAHSRLMAEPRAKLKRLVERLVRVRERHAAEQPVDLVVSDRRQRDAAGQVDVAGAVHREVHAIQPPVALEQEAVEGGVVLVLVTAEERLHLEAVVPGDQPGHRGELVLASQAGPDRHRARAGCTRGRALPSTSPRASRGVPCPLRPDPRCCLVHCTWAHTPWPSRSACRGPAESGRVPPRALGKCVQPPRQSHQPPDRLRPVRRVVAVRRDTRVIVPDDRAQPAHAGRHHGRAAGLGLDATSPNDSECDKGQHDRGRAVPVGELGLRSRAARTGRCR